MSFVYFPNRIDEIDGRRWETFLPYYEELLARPLTPATTRQWLADWSKLSQLIQEVLRQAYVDKSIDTTDPVKEQAYLDYINEVAPPARLAEQVLKERLLSLDITDEDMTLVLRQMRNEAELFHSDNVPIFTELAKLSNEYDKITGAMIAEWDGEEKNLNQLGAFLQDKDRAIRERAWKAMMDLWLADREKLNKLYADMLDLRQQIAANAGLPDYRAYAFRERGRFDYTSEDCFTFHQAIEEVVVPAAKRIYAKKQASLGFDSLRPWDEEVDPSDAPALQPYVGQEQLVAGTIRMFNQLDVQLAKYLAEMAEHGLLDLDTRPGKALGGYCTTLSLQQRPFIFMNGTGRHDDLQTMLHESGHAFHAFAAFAQPLIWQRKAPMEFCEVASMTMELLAAPYLTQDKGGFYTPPEAARALIEHLEGIITFLPYMAVVDAFQHWVYTYPYEAKRADNCDAAWDELWQRFLPGIDTSGFKDARVTGWHRKLHIFTAPFYYIEYGMAQVGALQVWRNSLSDPDSALTAYRAALALGGTKPLPALFAAAGAEFRFDTPMLTELVALIESMIEELEAAVS